MLFNRLFSFIALASLAVPILSAPLPLPKEFEIEHGPVEVEVECKGKKLETEVEIERRSPETEIETETKSELFKPVGIGPVGAKQIGRSEAEIWQEALNGPLGSIEKKVGTLMGEVHEGVNALNKDMKSFIGADQSTVYGNPSGGAQLTGTELAKIVSTYLLHIAQIEDATKHVSGYKFTSAQHKIREDLLSMKKTLGTISPEVLGGTANMMSAALSMGHGFIA
ncbi:hypothetical protein RhiXN_04804 [Rhizoctonia solani]|uniref:Secreted protein n=1 Tax=Rhizoctonia solani TaxID=456999 RepID=A0A8H8NR84_9AGAM|nr:uncharacterized protein RhiXN_04804 [Rhizoctonia solani]QRW16802.1 hypothetical protein RhiXN_04804 [Rhizoctonia solani]